MQRQQEEDADNEDEDEDDGDVFLPVDVEDSNGEDDDDAAPARTSANIPRKRRLPSFDEVSNISNELPAKLLVTKPPPKPKQSAALKPAAASKAAQPKEAPTKVLGRSTHPKPARSPTRSTARSPARTRLLNSKQKLQYSLASKANEPSTSNAVASAGDTLMESSKRKTAIDESNAPAAKITKNVANIPGQYVLTPTRNSKSTASRTNQEKLVSLNVGVTQPKKKSVIKRELNDEPDESGARPPARPPANKHRKIEKSTSGRRPLFVLPPKKPAEKPNAKVQQPTRRNLRSSDPKTK